MTSGPASRPAKDAEIWIICGNACAGKTTTARLLAQRLPRAAHVDGDEMQRLIVSPELAHDRCFTVNATCWPGFSSVLVGEFAH